MTAMVHSPPDRLDAAEIRRWGSCFGLVILCHVAVALFLVTRPGSVQPIDPPPLAIAVDLEPMPPPPPVPVRASPPMPAIMPAPPIVPKPVIALPKPSPKPANLQPPPEVEPQPVPQPIEPTPAAQSQPVEEVTPAPAPPRIAGPSPSYLGSVMNHLERYKRYPRIAMQRHLTGTVLLAFTIAPDGRVLAARIARSSGSSLLDDEVVELIQRAQPLPPMPAEMAQAPMDLTLPVPFTLR